jgi:Cation/multidrug efflux pump
MKVVTDFLKRPILIMSIYAVVTVITLLLFLKWPSSFLPSEDLGYFIVGVQLPNSASLSRTEDATAKIGDILNKYPEVDTYMTINGFSMTGGGQSSNGATIFVILNNWKYRKGKDHSASAVIDRLNEDAAAIQEAIVFAVDPPSIPGLGAMSGLSIEIEDINNYGSTDLSNAVNTIMENYHTEKNIMMLNSSFEGNSMQYYLNIDRDKLAMMGLQLNDVYNTLSDYMGVGYVNDFVEFGNIYQVIVQGDKNDRNSIWDILRLSVNNAKKEMVPFSSFTTIEERMGQDQISRYNMYTSAGITVIPAMTASSQEGIQAMDNLVKKLLGDSFGYEWTSIAYQENSSGSSTMLIFILAIVVVILVLSAQYESFTNPWAVILGVPLALLGAIIGCIIMKLPISIYTEIGIVLLIALSAKNGILIVEFAIDYRKTGQSILDSAMEAGKIRLRPILMTSFAFIFGVMPLLFATGAGSNARLALGAAVVFGMLFNTLFGTLFIPSFFYITQSLQEMFSRKSENDPKAIEANNNDLNL